jgi:hypothetical protein
MLRMTLDADATDAKAMLEASGMKIPQGSLTLVIDENGVYYRLPIAIINEPDEYLKDPNKEKLDNKAKPDSKARHLKIRSMKGDKEMDVTNLIGIGELKKQYLELMSLTDYKVENTRMFCMGKELKDEHFIYTYDIENDTTVQVMFRKSE